MSMLNKTGRRKAAAKKRDTKYLRGVAAAMLRCMGTGIFNLWHNAKGKTSLIPRSHLKPRRAPQPKHPTGGTVEKLAFPRRDNRNPWHPQHNDLHHGGAICDCMGVGHSRKALAPA